MGIGSDLHMYDVVVKNSRSLSHLLVSSCYSRGAALDLENFHLASLLLIYSHKFRSDI